MKTLFYNTLKDYCDALLSVQFKGTGDKTLDGGFYCRSCHLLHGRAQDAIYPLLVMAKRSGDSRYLDAAKAVYAYGDNFLCDDGSFYNDAQSTWAYTTVFYAISLCEALTSGRELLDPETRATWEKRLATMGEWLYQNIDEHASAVINYPVSNALAMALLGNYFNREAYRERGKRLAAYSMEHITENGLLWGEAHPREAVTPRGCRPIDIGYNMEESIPALVKYAFVAGNEAMKDRLADILRRALAFMLPDGAWDNSFGIRNNKWTYWGSRTSDGCAPAFVLLADRNKAFAEAARRNTELLAACTHDGFLYGGPHYREHGEYPCTHHTFEHASSIAFALEHLTCEYEPAPLPIDEAPPLSHYPEIDTYKIAHGDYRSTLTGYDFQIGEGRHIGGGTLTMLYKYGIGPMIAASVIDYKMVEIHNMQLPRDKAHHRPLVPRLAVNHEALEYSTGYFPSPCIQATEKNRDTVIEVTTGLCAKNGNRLPDDIERRFCYRFTDKGITVEIANAFGAKFILPLIAGELELSVGALQASDRIFFLTGGFTATEYVIAPDENGKISFVIR